MMKVRPQKALSVTAVLLTAMLHCAATARADDEDHLPPTLADRRAAVPLKDVVERIDRDFGGRLLSVQLEKERVYGDHVLIYEAKILLPEGAVLKLYYDARTLRLLKKKGRHRERRRRRGFWSWTGDDDGGHRHGGDDDDD